MSSLNRRAGWVMIDHRASPGTPEIPEGTLHEWAVYTCGHCQIQVVMNNERTRPREVCLNCMSVVCDPCHGLGVCEPFLKVAEQAAEAAYQANSSGLLLPDHTSQ